jgi:hypothetical protein
MTSEQVAEATLKAIESGKRETNLTRGGWWLVLANRIAPRLVDLIIRRRVERLMKAARESEQAPEPAGAARH